MAIETLPFSPDKDPKRSKKSFEEQFRKYHTMEVGGKKIDYCRIFPEQLSSDVPVVLLPGFTENPPLLKKLLKRLYDDQRLVYTFTYPRERLDIELNGRPQAQEQKIQATLGLINEARSLTPHPLPDRTVPQGKVDMIGRSDGGVNATLAATRQPDWISNLILVDTKLTHPENAISLTGRFLGHAIKEGRDIFTRPIEQVYLRHGVQQGVNYVAFHPTMSTQEIFALAETDIRSELPKLRQHGIGVYGIHGAGDKIFPMQDTQKEIARAGGKQLFDGFYATKRNIDHASIYNNDAYINLISYAVKAARMRSEK